MSQIFILHDDSKSCEKPVNVSSVPQLSPFRYPGGKTWFVPLFRRWMTSFAQRPTVLIEPFAGGGILSLTAAFEKLAARVVMVELDANVSAVWKAILGGDAKRLATQIQNFELTVESARHELSRVVSSNYERAFQTILKNRTAHGGILAEGAGILKHGENGKGILSRWYPQTIAKRIAKIAHIANRIDFIEGDAFAVMTTYCADPDAAFVIDPPYTAGGKRAGARLYNHSEIDHERLFAMCDQMRGDFLLTYDNAPEVRALAQRHGFAFRPIAMKNTHHAEMTELVISRNLSWIDESMALQETPTANNPTSSLKRRPVRYPVKSGKESAKNGQTPKALTPRVRAANRGKGAAESGQP